MPYRIKLSEDDKNLCFENTRLNVGSCFFNTDQEIIEFFCQSGFEGKNCEINNKGQIFFFKSIVLPLFGKDYVLMDTLNTPRSVTKSVAFSLSLIK